MTSDMDTFIQDVDFDKGNGLVPAVIQHADTADVLMLGYMNRESLEKTIAEGVVWFYSRSKQRLWKKGETSGHILTVSSYHLDCDNDSVLILAWPAGHTCHLGRPSCFGDATVSRAWRGPLGELEDVITQRSKQSPPTYTTKLCAGGMNLAAQKVGEEAIETVIALINEEPSKVVSEAADLIYHLLVSFHLKQVSWQQILHEIHQRRHTSQPLSDKGCCDVQ